MTILINIACYVTGLITGVALMAVIAAKAYQKGKEDGRAYDVEKVLAELEEYKQSEINFKGIVDTGKASSVVSRTIGRIEAYESAIDIVRKGGTV